MTGEESTPAKAALVDKKRDHDLLEVTATVLLGIAVVAIAWATFQASK